MTDNKKSSGSSSGSPGSTSGGDDPLEIWGRLDSEVPDALLRAVCGAFALVACADGQVAEAETERFLGLVVDNEAFARLDRDTLASVFRDMSGAILADFEAGQQHVLETIAVVKDNPEHAALAVAAAQIAIIADGRLDDVEEVELARICGALGLDPADY